MALNSKRDVLIKNHDNQSNEYIIKESPEGAKKIKGKNDSKNLEKILKKAIIYKVITNRSLKNRISDKRIDAYIKVLFA